MSSPAAATVDLAAAVNDLVQDVEGVRHAIVLSADGLVVAASAGLNRDDADHLAAAAAGLNSLARGAGRFLGDGPVRRTVIELDTGFMFVTAAGTGSCLAVLCHAHIDAGLVGYETERLVLRIEQATA